MLTTICLADIFVKTFNNHIMKPSRRGQIVKFLNSSSNQLHVVLDFFEKGEKSKVKICTEKTGEISYVFVRQLKVEFVKTEMLDKYLKDEGRKFYLKDANKTIYIPNRAGQIVKFHTLLEDESPNDIYLVLEFMDDGDKSRVLVKSLNTGYSMPWTRILKASYFEVDNFQTENAENYAKNHNYGLL